MFCKTSFYFYLQKFSLLSSLQFWGIKCQPNRPTMVSSSLFCFLNCEWYSFLCLCEEHSQVMGNWASWQTTSLIRSFNVHHSSVSKMQNDSVQTFNSFITSPVTGIITVLQKGNGGNADERSWKKDTPDREVGKPWFVLWEVKLNMGLSESSVKVTQLHENGITVVCWSKLGLGCLQHRLLSCIVAVSWVKVYFCRTWR